MRTAPSLDLGLLILRVGVGGFILTHGYGKLEMLLAGNAAQFADPIGIGKQLSLVMAVLTEFGGGLCVVLGLLTRIAAAGVVFTMGVAAFVVHAADPWVMQGTGPSKEPALLFLIPFLALVCTGPGRFAADAWMGARRQQRKPEAD